MEEGNIALTKMALMGNEVNNRTFTFVANHPTQISYQFTIFIQACGNNKDTHGYYINALQDWRK